MKKGDYGQVLNYIEKYWKKSEFYLPKGKGMNIGLPYPFISPNHTRFKYDFFYWDTYFTNLGLVESGRIKQAKYHVNNLVYLYREFGIIPSRSRYYDLGLSQPPFLTSMILDVYEHTKDKRWLKRVTGIAEHEHKEYWSSKDYHGKKGHMVYKGLSRYCDHFGLHLTSEHESGWDMTSRYKEKCLDYLSVDLNSCLYKYETDFQKIYSILGLKSKVRKYRRLARERKKEMNRLMWSEKRGFFFDYNYKREKRSRFYSLAGYYPMWAGIASEEQAKRMVNHLRVFECRGGLANSQKERLSKEFRQWDYPNGWPNQQWIAVKALLDYRYRKDALRIARKWLALNKKVFVRTGKMWEKYDVARLRAGKDGRYPTQPGFGWTNAVFLKMARLLEG